MTMRPKPVVEPGTKHFPPHLVGIQKPVLVKEEEVRVAFDYLSQGKGSSPFSLILYFFFCIQFTRFS